MRKVSKNLFIIAGVVLAFVLGVGLGFSLKLGFVQEPVAPKTVLENKLVQGISLSVAGRVAKIEGQEIILEQGGDSFSFLVQQDAQINRLETLPPPEPGMAEELAPLLEKKIGLEDIRVGDQVSAFLEKTGEDKFIAHSILVIVE